MNDAARDDDDDDDARATTTTRDDRVGRRRRRRGTRARVAVRRARASLDARDDGRRPTRARASLDGNDRPDGNDASFEFKNARARRARATSRFFLECGPAARKKRDAREPRRKRLISASALAATPRARRAPAIATFFVYRCITGFNAYTRVG